MTEPKYQMPALTEQERDLCMDEAEKLLKTLRPGSYGYHMAQITLAALTSEPAGWGLKSLQEDRYGSWLMSTPREQSYLDYQPHKYKNVQLYTAPPVPVLKPIELPEVEKWRKVDQVRAQMSYQHLVADSLISDGYEVKE